MQPRYLDRTEKPIRLNRYQQIDLEEEHPEIR